MENGISVKLGRYAWRSCAVGVAVHAMRYMAVPANIWLGVDEGIRRVIERVPLQALTHMIFGPIALLAGPFQFLPGLRARRPRLHRWTGTHLRRSPASSPASARWRPRRSHRAGRSRASASASSRSAG